MGWLYNRYRFCRGRDLVFGGICCRGLCDLVDWNILLAIIGGNILVEVFATSWIEISPDWSLYRFWPVEVFATSWIEISKEWRAMRPVMSRSLRPRGLKCLRYLNAMLIWASRGLCDLVDWNIIACFCIKLFYSRGLCDLVDWNIKALYLFVSSELSRSLRPRGLK